MTPSAFTLRPTADKPAGPPYALPTAAVPEILIVSVPPLPRAACDRKDDDGSNHKGDDKNGNRVIHRNLPCCQNLRGNRVVKSPGESQEGNNLAPMAFLLAARRGSGFRPLSH
jgi:hypothetical protein